MVHLPALLLIQQTWESFLSSSERSMLVAVQSLSTSANVYFTTNPEEIEVNSHI
jgi:hypothetical protein